MDPWTPYPGVDLPELDAEHRALGKTVRAFLDATRHDDRERALSLGRKLAAAVTAHFAHEERLMREVGYAHEERHTRTHLEFLAEAAQQLEIVKARGLSAEVLRWASQLDEWFHRHVMTEDLWLAHAVNRARAERQANPSK